MEAIKIEQERNQRLIDLIALSEKSTPAGRLALDRRGDAVYCYAHRYQHGKRVEKQYLGTLTSERVRAHVAAKMNDELMHRLCSNRSVLQNLERRYKDDTLSAILAALPNSYRTAATAIVNANCSAGIVDAHGNRITSASQDHYNERYEELRAWANADYLRNMTPFPKSKTYTKNGRRVRSKGECIFCNIFDDIGVFFRYDSILTITDQDGREKRVSPDFLIQCFDGSLIIVEHLGWYTGQKYGIDFGDKCYWYLQNGFVLGKNFFVTSDDKYGGTDSRAIYNVARKVERLFYGY